MSNKYILVVEDEAELRQDLVETLAFEGYETGAAGDAETGLAMIDARLPDLILCDIRLPGMSGLELLKTLNDRAAPSPRVVLLTAFGDAELLNESRALNALDCLQKPVDYGQLTELLETYLAQAGASHPAPATVPAASAEPPVAIAPTAVAAPVASAAMAMPMILVVEDDHSLADEMIELLDCYGIAACHSASVTDAMARLRDENRIVGAVVDQGLGPESGFDLLRSVAADPALAARGLRFGILSGAVCDPAEIAKLPIQPVGTILKPAAPAELMAMMAAIIGTA